MKNILHFFLCPIFLASSFIVNAETIYVVPGGAGSQAGTSWANAKTLYDGINDASATDEVWVKVGTYTIPSSSVLSPSCPVYGSFAGNEAALSGRATMDPTTTIIENQSWVFSISGAALNDMHLKNNGSNQSEFELKDAVIRNCIIEGGRFDIGISLGGVEVYGTTFKDHNSNSAIQISSGGKATFYDCEFHHLTASEGGVIISEGVLEVHRGIFHDNTASVRGGVLVASSGAISKFYNSLFYQNESPEGSVFYFIDNLSTGLLELFNCTITDCSTTGELGHGTIELNGVNGNLNIYNSILWGNTGGSGIIVNGPLYAGTQNVFNNILEVDIVLGFGAATINKGNNDPADPLFVDAATNDYRLMNSCGPAIDAGDNTFVNGTQDLEQNPRTVNTITDRGAYELQSACLPLPIELIDFKGSIENKKAMLTWSTAFEEKNVGFEIQKRSDANDFKTIAWVRSQGNSNQTSIYTFEDEHIFPNVDYYYRLKQIDLDGRYDFSPLIFLRMAGKEDFNTLFAPNPASNGFTLLNIKASEYEWLTLTLYDAVGKLCYQKNTFVNEGFNQIRMEFGDIASGVYFCKVRMRHSREFLQLRVVR